MPEQQSSQERLNPHGMITSVHTRRTQSRSPHPYHRQRAELPDATLRPGATLIPFTPPLFSSHNNENEAVGEGRNVYARHASPGKSTESDSGTEADDEHFLKGLPAPRWRPHKGLRGVDGAFSGTSSPLVSPAVVNGGTDSLTDYMKPFSAPIRRLNEGDICKASERFGQKRRAEIGRRCTELGLLLIVGSLVYSSRGMVLLVRSWELELSSLIFTTLSLIVLYPFRLIIYLASTGRRPSITIPAAFDPAPLLYPPALTMLVSLILSISNQAVILPNIILSIASLPSELIPTIHSSEVCNRLHWFLSCVPIFIHESQMVTQGSDVTNSFSGDLPREALVLLYPLHQTICATLHYLTTTSLLRAELQLLSTALINLLLLSTSPQAVILKALLWIGGLGMLITCTQVLRWVVTLARVPRWRFRRVKRNRKPSIPVESGGAVMSLLSIVRGLFRVKSGDGDSSDEEGDLAISGAYRDSLRRRSDVQDLNGVARPNTAHEQKAEESTPTPIANKGRSFAPGKYRQRSHTLPNIGLPVPRSNHSTPSGRRKRSASSSVQSFFSLTERQATIRKWIYAGYVYICVFCIIFIGIRTYIGRYALNGNEPIGWALGYLFGNISWFRMKVMTSNLEGWVHLPDRIPTDDPSSSQHGWMEHIRQARFGAANTRLLLSAYWLTIIISGLTIVFRLSAIYEVDTRRKVFHFMMVAMLLPTTFIDPPFCALALSLILAIFLLLDLFRATQLPPLSKPLASFLTPYVDGRDLRGPVVISHIFLLIGCAIPLWLSLASLSRIPLPTCQSCNADWDLPSRDLSMVSGVICVGMGDAAASLIGRRYGRHKWFWPGGKSLQGSLAFAVAVATALMAAKVWLLVGGWHDGMADGMSNRMIDGMSDGSVRDAWLVTGTKVTVAAALASLTEAVLTGGNDNVVVPVVLWVLVKALRI